MKNVFQSLLAWPYDPDPKEPWYFWVYALFVRLSTITIVVYCGGHIIGDLIL